MEYRFLQEGPIFMTRVGDRLFDRNCLQNKINSTFMIFKINTYNPITGIREPLIIVRPQNKTGKVQRQETKTTVREIDSLVSLLDIMPTILDWHNVTIPNHLTGKSLLPQLGTFSMIR